MFWTAQQTLLLPPKMQAALVADKPRAWTCDHLANEECSHNRHSLMFSSLFPHPPIPSPASRPQLTTTYNHHQQLTTTFQTFALLHSPTPTCTSTFAYPLPRQAHYNQRRTTSLRNEPVKAITLLRLRCARSPLRVLQPRLDSCFSTKTPLPQNSF